MKTLGAGFLIRTQNMTRLSDITCSVRCAIVLLLGGLFVSTAAQAQYDCYSIDLKTGDVPSGTIPYVDFVVLPEDSNADSYFETVLKVTLSGFVHPDQPREVGFLVYYDIDPTGITVNIGDSSTNNGGAGDAGTQSNDAELTVGGLLSHPAEYDELRVFGHDGLLDARGTQQIAQISNVVKQGETLALAVADEQLHYRNRAVPINGVINSTWLYALKGQADSEGPVNYDIYAAFNRVIAINSDRRGTGVAKVSICFNP